MYVIDWFLRNADNVLPKSHHHTKVRPTSALYLLKSVCNKRYDP